MLNRKIARINGVKHLGSERVFIKEVNMDPKRNATRSTGMKNDHVQSLCVYIEENGIDETIPKPVLEKIPYIDRNLSSNKGKKYYIVDGNHRITAFDSIGMREFDADIVEFEDETAREDAQQAANNHPPQLDADMNSVVDTLSKQIRRGDLVNVKDDISKKVGILYRGKKKKVRDQIVAEIVKRNGSHEQFRDWSEKASSQFLWDNYERTTAFGWDANREVYGAVMKQGSEYRIIARAIHRFNQVAPNGETNVPTEVVIAVLGHGDATVREKRQQVIDTANELLDDILDAVGMDVWPNGYPIRFVGALPQDFGSSNPEDPNRLIEIDSDTDCVMYD